MRVFFFVGLRTQKENNKNRCNKRNCRCNLGTVDDVVNIEIYHACNSHSIRIAAIVLTIHKIVLCVKLLILLPDKGISRSKAEAAPVRIDEATRKLARYNRSSLIFQIIAFLLLAYHILTCKVIINCYTDPIFYEW